MPTETLLKEIIGTLRNLRLEMIGTQWEMCGHAINYLQEVLKYVPEPEPSNTPSLCLETSEENMKTKSTIISLVEEIDRTYDAICYVIDDYSGPQEEVLNRLQKALKHLDKALIILEGDED